MRQRVFEAIPVLSHGPLRVASFVWRADDGRRGLTVVCKATYALRPEVSPLAMTQDDIHGEGDARSSLKAPSDIIPF